MRLFGRRRKRYDEQEQGSAQQSEPAKPRQGRGPSVALEVKLLAVEDTGK